MDEGSVISGEDASSFYDSTVGCLYVQDTVKCLN